MYQTHDEFTPPSHPEAQLWRYIDLARFLSMLEDRALFFGAASSMTDRFEGSWTAANVALRGLKGEAYASFVEQVTAPQARLMRHYTYLNCWHASEYESAAMWELYQRDGRGVAIQSTFEKLVTSLQGEPAVFAGIVQYIDYDTTPIPEGNLLTRFLRKRLSFEHEHEVRALVWDSDAQAKAWHGAGNRYDPAFIGPPGIRISVDLDRLVEAVYIAPDAPEWFTGLVESLVTRYSRSWPVRQSDLSRDPMF